MNQFDRGYVRREELMRILDQYKIWGDEQSITVDQTAGGQVIRSLATIGGAGGGSSDDIEVDFTPYLFGVTIAGPTSVTISAGVAIIGEDKQDIPQQTYSWGTGSAYLVFRLYYASGWNWVYEKSSTFPTQTQYDDGTALRNSEAFTIAYLTDGASGLSDVQQLEHKAIRCTRLT